MISSRSIQATIRMVRLHAIIFGIIYSSTVITITGMIHNPVDIALIIGFVLTIPAAFNIMNNIWHRKYDEGREAIHRYTVMTDTEITRWRRIAWTLVLIGIATVIIRFMITSHNLMYIATITIGVPAAYVYNRYGKEIGALAEIFLYIAYLTAALYVIIPVHIHMDVLPYVLLLTTSVWAINWLNHVNDYPHEKERGARTIVSDIDEFLRRLRRKKEAAEGAATGREEERGEGGEKTAKVLWIAIPASFILVGTGLMLYTVWSAAATTTADPDSQYQLILSYIAGILYLAASCDIAYYHLRYTRFVAGYGVVMLNYSPATDRRMRHVGRYGSAVILTIAMIMHMLSSV